MNHFNIPDDAAKLISSFLPHSDKLALSATCSDLRALYKETLTEIAVPQYDRIEDDTLHSLWQNYKVTNSEDLTLELVNRGKISVDNIDAANIADQNRVHFEVMPTDLLRAIIREDDDAVMVQLTLRPDCSEPCGDLKKYMEVLNKPNVKYLRLNDRLVKKSVFLNEAIAAADLSALKHMNPFLKIYMKYSIDRRNYDALTEILINMLNEGDMSYTTLCWNLIKIFINSRASIGWIEKIVPSMHLHGFLVNYRLTYLIAYLDNYHRYGLVKQLIRRYSFEDYNVPNTYIHALIKNDKEVIPIISDRLDYHSCIEVFKYAVNLNSSFLTNYIIGYAMRNIGSVKKYPPEIIRKSNDRLFINAVKFAKFEIMRDAITLAVKSCEVYNSKSGESLISVDKNIFVQLFTKGVYHNYVKIKNEQLVRFYKKCAFLLGITKTLA